MFSAKTQKETAQSAKKRKDRWSEVIKVSVELRSGSARYRVGVQAKSIRRALSIVGGRHPNGAIRVRLPMDSEGFYIEDPAARAGGGIVRAEQQPRRLAA